MANHPRPSRLAGTALAGTILLVACGGSTTGTIASSDVEGAVASPEAEAEAETETETASPIAAAASSGGDMMGSLASGTVHEVAVTFAESDYEAMIDVFLATEEKEWIEASVVIDGVTYERVGLRLKGNSSLRSVANGAGSPTVNDAASLPWLIDLDRFVDGQQHEGLVEFVIRSNSSATSLNEAVALDLLELAGLASQDAAMVAFRVNGGDAVLRLAIEHPDDVWMAEELNESGALYKAESSGDYSDRGDDPESYADVFDQEAGKDNTDLVPLIDFLDFVNNNDDTTFAAELSTRLDVEAFARYLAMSDLLDNFDDIDGPGNNSYLYYDTSSGQFTVVPWDYNLAFGASPGGGGAPGGGGGAAAASDGRGPGADGGGGFDRSNILVERFLAVDQYNMLYQQALVDLRSELVDSGVANQVLERWTAVVEASGLVDEATLADEAAEITHQFG